MLKSDIIYSALFKKFPELVFGFSTKHGGVSPEPFCMNLSASVGDDIENVKKNREIFFRQLEISEDNVTFQKQIHSAIINYSPAPSHFEGCDAVYTDIKNNYLAVSVADCIPVFLFDPEKKIVAGIHSGWKGTHGKIVTVAIEKLKSQFSVKPSGLYAYIGPGISQEKYEVGPEVGTLFSEEICIYKNGKYYPDLKKENFNQLVKAGLKKENIEVSELCTFTEKDLLHSYRRDGVKSGRMFGVIGVRS